MSNFLKKFLVIIVLATGFQSQTAVEQESVAIGVVVEIKKDYLPQLRSHENFHDLKTEYLLEEISYDENKGLLKLNSILQPHSINGEDFIAFCYLVKQLEIVLNCYPNHTH